MTQIIGIAVLGFVGVAATITFSYIIGFRRGAKVGYVYCMQTNKFKGRR